jgi:hypothetical protein
MNVPAHVYCLDRGSYGRRAKRGPLFEGERFECAMVLLCIAIKGVVVSVQGDQY